MHLAAIAPLPRSLELARPPTALPSAPTTGRRAARSRLSWSAEENVAWAMCREPGGLRRSSWALACAGLAALRGALRGLGPFQLLGLRENSRAERLSKRHIALRQRAALRNPVPAMGTALGERHVALRQRRVQNPKGLAHRQSE